MQDLTTNPNYFGTKIVKNCHVILDTPIFKKVLARVSEPEPDFFSKLGARAGFFSSSEPEPALTISTRLRNPDIKAFGNFVN